MSPDHLPPPPPPPSSGKGTRSNPAKSDSAWPRWSLWVLLGLVTASIVASSLLSSGEDASAISYDTFMSRVEAGQVKSVEINNDNAKITGERTNGDKFTTTGPLQGGIPEADLATMREQGVEIEFKTPESGIFATLIPLLLPVALLIGFFWWMQRRAQGQMSGIMSIGRSKAKTYSTERPGTTFADVAGYEGVKQEITEVVDFLKHPERFG
jgi:cell division protease FtsH